MEDQVEKNIEHEMDTRVIQFLHDFSILYYYTSQGIRC